MSVVPFSADIADIAGVLINIQPEPSHFRFAVLQSFKLLLGLQARPGVVSPMLHISLNNPLSIPLSVSFKFDFYTFNRFAQ